MILHTLHQSCIIRFIWFKLKAGRTPPSSILSKCICISDFLSQMLSLQCGSLGTKTTEKLIADHICNNKVIKQLMKVKSFMKYKALVTEVYGNRSNWFKRSPPVWQELTVVSSSSTASTPHALCLLIVGMHQLYAEFDNISSWACLQ